MVVGTLLIERDTIAPPVVVVAASSSTEPGPRPTTTVPRRMEGRVVALLGDKLVASPSEVLGVVGATPSPSPVMVVADGRVLVQGTGAGADRRTGTWLFDPSGRKPAVFLGASSGFTPALEPGRVWLAASGAVREVLDDGTVVTAPATLGGALVGRAGAGLIVQRGTHV